VARALLWVPLIVYLLLPTRNYYWDGVGMAVDIEKHAPLSALLYPSHLIYALCGSWLYRAAITIGIKTRALYLMQGANSLLGGLCVPLVYRMLRRAGVVVTSSVAGALLFAFSATWWKFATDANAYLPSIFFLLCAYALVEDGRVIPAAIAHAIAMLFHELAIVFLPVAWIMLRDRRRVEYAAAAIAPVIAVYAIAYRMVFGEISGRGLLGWATVQSVPHAGHFSFNALRNAGLSVRGTLRLVFGGRLSDVTTDVISKLALAGLVISAVVLIAALRRGVRAEKPAFPRAWLMWIGCYVAFLFLWIPENTFYRLYYLPPLIALAVVFIRPLAAALLVPVLFFSNLAFLIEPQSRPEKNAPLQFALSQRGRWTPGTPILFSRFYPDLWTICYFSPGTSWISMEQTDIPALDRALEYAHSQQTPLWLDAQAYQMIAANAEGRRWLSEHERPAERIESTDSRHDFRFYGAR